MPESCEVVFFQSLHEIRCRVRSWCSFTQGLMVGEYQDNLDLQSKRVQISLRCSSEINCQVDMVRSRNRSHLESNLQWIRFDEKPSSILDCDDWD